jgi:hypothetical protein
MKKGFHTYDLLYNKALSDITDLYKIALACGLECRQTIFDNVPAIEMWGTKGQFIRYYFKSVRKYNFTKDIKRLLSTIFW